MSARGRGSKSGVKGKASPKSVKISKGILPAPGSVKRAVVASFESKKAASFESKKATPEEFTSDELLRVKKLQAQCLRLTKKKCPVCKAVAKCFDDFKWALVTVINPDEFLNPNELSIVPLDELKGHKIRTFSSESDEDKRVSIYHFGTFLLYALFLKMLSKKKYSIKL
jgi:hypothetical protein